MATATSTGNHSGSNRNTRYIGTKGETRALRFLQGKGYRIIARNYRCVFGEIDIIATHGETIAFIEVKSRTSDRFGRPEEAVVTRKQKKISQTAQHYLAANNLEDRTARFDVVAIHFSPDGETVELIQDAFDLAVP